MSQHSEVLIHAWRPHILHKANNYWWRYFGIYLTPKRMTTPGAVGLWTRTLMVLWDKDSFFGKYLSIYFYTSPLVMCFISHNEREGKKTQQQIVCTMAIKWHSVKNCFLLTLTKRSYIQLGFWIQFSPDEDLWHHNVRVSASIGCWSLLPANRQ